MTPSPTKKNKEKRERERKKEPKKEREREKRNKKKITPTPYFISYFTSYKKLARQFGMRYGALMLFDRKENYFEKESLYLSDLFVFFKMKNFSEIENFCPTGREFLAERDRVRNIISSFLEFDTIYFPDEPEACIPLFIRENYRELQEVIGEESLSYFEGICPDLELVINFFKNKFYGKVLNRCDFSIQTKNGQTNISLNFAENFRFKSEKDHLNLFHLHKNERDLIIPASKDHVIFVADYKQFEFRTYLNLIERSDLICEDLYNKVGGDLNVSSSDVKVAVISSLYGSKRDAKFENFFKKEEVVSKIKNNLYWYNEHPVFVPEEHETPKKIHTITQTISQFFYLKKLDGILDLLQNRASKFIFPLHDSIIISLHKDEMFLIDEIVNVMEDEIYKVKLYLGENFRDLKEV